MNRQFISKSLIAVTALALSLSVSLGVALAYFSDYEEASGGATLSLGGQTELTEGSDRDSKDIVIRNTGETNMIVRVAIYGAEEFMQPLQYDKSDWFKAGDFYYYTKVLLPGESTSDILAELRTEWKGEEPEYSFDVTVVHEGAQAVYNGKALATPEGWDAKGVAAIAPAAAGEEVE